MGTQHEGRDSCARRARGSRPQALDEHCPLRIFNRKGNFAIVVQAMCDGNRKFCMMSAEHQGACPDATAWNTSSFFNSATGLAARGGVPAPYFILADAAYGLTEYILTPYDGNNLPADKDSYNFGHSHYRMNIE
mmetsp:Transcript_24147/g.57292  ORF Transcript_24147/g.57292 Transcript_24147/m.57292 type:complete len:134 (+) Transcript_24147:1595-1996(+)